jgi:hypothetical protein
LQFYQFTPHTQAELKRLHENHSIHAMLPPAWVSMAKYLAQAGEAGGAGNHCGIVPVKHGNPPDFALRLPKQVRLSGA